MDGVAIVTINRPEARNALNSALLHDLRETLARLEHEEDSGAVILTGGGDAFIAGADIKEMRTKTVLDARTYSELGQECAHMLETMRKPTLAAINGYALGGGLELALGCDIRYASTRAKLGQPEVNLGIIPGWGGYATARPRRRHWLREGADPDRPDDRREGGTAARSRHRALRAR